MKYILVFVLSFGCSLNQSIENANEDTFARTFSASDSRLEEALVSSLNSWNEAACLDLLVADKAAHTFAWGNATNMRSGRQAETMGNWYITNSRIWDDEPEPWHYTDELLQNLISHEIGHILSYSNGHAQDGVFGPGMPYDGRITLSTLEKVCEAQYCKCFNYE